MSDTVVARAKVQQLADSFRELMALKGKQAATQAKIIRWCVMALTQTTDQAQRSLERQRRHLKGHKAIVRMHEPGKKVREDRELALLYLQWLATKLEDEEPDGELDIRVNEAILKAQ